MKQLTRAHQTVFQSVLDGAQATACTCRVCAIVRENAALFRDDTEGHKNWHAYLDKVVAALSRSMSEQELALVHSVWNRGLSVDYAVREVLGHPHRFGA